MPPPAPILPYASSAPRLPVHLAVILYLWAILDLLGGISFTLLGFFLLPATIPSQFILFPCLLMLLGPALIVWSATTCYLASHVLAGETDALHRAIILTTIAEIATWILTLTLWIAVAIINLPGGRGPRSASDFVIPLFTLIFPVAVTITRLLLRRAARRLPAS